jgi:hypothetical protein
MSSRTLNRRSLADRYVALRVEPKRLQLAIAQLKQDERYQITIDEQECELPGGWFSGDGDELFRNAIANFTSRQQLRWETIAISLDAGYCVTRAAMGPSDEVDRELEMLHLRVPRYLQLGPGEKTTGSTRSKLTPGIEYAVTGVVNQRILETIYRVIDDAGIKVAWIEPSLVSVARLIGATTESEDPVLIADGSGAHWDLGIAYQGKLMLDYRPAGGNSDDALVKSLDGHISRLHRFCHRHRKIATGGLKKLYICTENDQLSQALAKLGARNDLEVRVLEVPELDSVYNIEPDFKSSKYVSIVSALWPLMQSMSAAEIPDMLCKIRRAPDRPPLVQWGLSLLPAMIVTFVLATLFILVQRERNQAALISDNRTQIESQMVRTQARVVELTSQREYLSALEGLAKHTPNYAWDELIRQIAQCLPGDARVVEFRVEIDGQVRIDGVAGDTASVYDIVDYFRHLPQVTQVALQGTTPEPQGTGTRFTVRLSIHRLAGELNHE